MGDITLSNVWVQRLQRTVTPLTAPSDIKNFSIKMAELENSKVRGEGTEEADTNKEVKNMILVDNQRHESDDHKELEEDYKNNLKEYVEDQSGQDQSPGQDDKLKN